MVWFDLSSSRFRYYLATAAEDCTIKLWDLRYLTNFRTIPLEGETANSVKFDFSGKYLIVGANDVRYCSAVKCNDLLATSLVQGARELQPELGRSFGGEEVRRSL